MKRRLIGLASWAITGGVVALSVILFRPIDRALVADVYVLFLGAIVLLALVGATREADVREGPSAFERALRRQVSAGERLPELARLEREVDLACATAFDLHYRLRPTLREIAAHRLASHRGLDLDAEAEAARAVLGDTAWELVEPNRMRPRDRLALGIPQGDLRAVIERIEAV